MRKSLYLLLIFCCSLSFASDTKALTIPAITGASAVCVGSATLLIDSIPGGTWHSNNAAIASVDSATGVVTGVSAGTAIITYSVDTNFITTTITVDTFINAGIITGPDSVCTGATIILVDTIPGGMWLRSNNNVIDSMGIITGISAGIDTIMYIFANSCGADTAFKVIKINTHPISTIIIGPNIVCLGKTMTLSNANPNGIWIITNPSATISNTGVVTGITLGLDTVLYAIANSCGTDTAGKDIIVSTLPDAGVITGPASLCVNANISLSDTTKGGIWSSSNKSVTLSGSLMVTGVTAGVDTIWYKASNTCGIDTAMWVITVDPLPPVPPITRTKNLLSVPSSYDAYQWTMNGSDIAGATNNMYLATSLQNYFVIVTNSFGCRITSPPQTITELECTPDDIRIYPNPASAVIHIDWCKKITANITGMDGKTIRSIKNVNDIDLTLLPNASYILNIFDQHGNRIKTMPIKKVSK